MDIDITIAIPAEKDSRLLQQCIAAVARFTTNYKLIVSIEPELNVAENRQLIMNNATTRYICFLDSDSIMIMPWLDAMMQVINRPDAGAVFIREWWGTELLGGCFHPTGGIVEIPFGPSACMLIDRTKIPDSLKWDHNIGLRSGWLGGDYEEVEYQYRLKYMTNCKFYMCTDVMFHHIGNKTTKTAYFKTDRAKTAMCMQTLLDYKYILAPEDNDWFKGLTYVPADCNNDNMFATGNILDCYGQVVKRNGLQKRSMIRKLGLCA